MNVIYRKESYVAYLASLTEGATLLVQCICRYRFHTRSVSSKPQTFFDVQQPQRTIHDIFLINFYSFDHNSIPLPTLISTALFSFCFQSNNLEETIAIFNFIYNFAFTETRKLLLLWIDSLSLGGISLIWNEVL